MEIKKYFLLLLAVSVFTACGEKSSSTKTKKRPALVEASDLNQPANPQHLACAQETCGKAADLPYVTAPHQQVDREFFQSYIKDSLEQYLKINYESVQLRNQILNRFSEMQIDRVSDPYMVLLNFMYFYRYSEQISKSLEVSNSKIRVDINNLRRALISIGLTDGPQINWIILIARTMYESEIFYANYYLSQFPLEIFVEKAYPGKSLLDAIAEEATKLQQIQDRLVENYPVFNSNSTFTKTVFEKAMKKIPLAPYEKQEFIDSRMNLLSLRELLPGGRWRGFFLQRPVNIKSMAAEILNQAKTSALAKLDLTELKNEANSLNYLCSFYLTSNIASSPTPEQNLRFENQIRTLKSDAKTVLRGSRYDTPAVSMAIDKITIMLPSTKQESAVAISRSLKNEIEANVKTMKLVSELNLQNQTDKEIVLLMLASRYQDEDEKESPLNAVKKFCEKHLPETISDASYSAYQKINLGWRSVLYPQYGYGIASHEMGHVISAADQLSARPSFTNVKNCLIANQNGNDKLSEEDFADAFAVQIMKIRPQSNYSCLLLEQEKQEYTDLKMTTPADHTHSSSFY